MRSRYTAYVRGHLDHLVRTWHPRTRPADLAAAPDAGWRGLRIIAIEGGGPQDDTGTVEFVAEHAQGDLHECSLFERRAGRWVYVASLR